MKLDTETTKQLSSSLILPTIYSIVCELLTQCRPANHITRWDGRERFCYGEPSSIQEPF